MAKCNDKLESHSAKEKFPQTDKLSAKNSLHRNPSGPSGNVESDNHPTQPKPQKPMRTPTERLCALSLWSYRLAMFVVRAVSRIMTRAVVKVMAKVVCTGDFPQAMRQ